MMTVTRYQQIAEDLIRQIEAGHHPVGSNLPTELELMATHAASRNTVRTALKQLQTMGLVSRRRSRGTTVEALPQGGGGFGLSLHSLHDLIHSAGTDLRTIVDGSEVVMDIDSARELGCMPGSRWLRLSMLRRVPGQRKPLGWTEAHVDPHYTELRGLADRNPDKLLSDLLETRFGRRIDRVELTVQACALPADKAAQVQALAGSPALRVVRRYRDGSGSLAIVTQSWYPADRYAIKTSLSRAP